MKRKFPYHSIFMMVSFVYVFFLAFVYFSIDKIRFSNVCLGWGGGAVRVFVNSFVLFLPVLMQLTLFKVGIKSCIDHTHIYKWA